MLPGRPRIHHDHTQPKPLFIAILAALLLVAAVPISTANTVGAISWGHDSDGNTTITIVCSEPLESSSFRSYPIGDPPRAVIVVEGITNRLKPETMAIEDRHVTRLRLGYPTDGSPPEMHIILDLASDAAEVLDILPTGNRLVAVIGSPNKTRVTPSPMSSPSPEASPEPKPSSTPSPQPTEQPPAPTVFPSVTPAQTYPDLPAPPVLPTIVATPTSALIPSSTPTQPAAFFSSPTPEPEPEIANQIVDVVANLRIDGSTLLRITAAGRIPHGVARTLKIADEPPRIILSLRGMSAPELPRTIEISDPNLERIRLIHDAETSEGELHLVLQLERPGVSVIDIKQVGPHLVLHLAVEDSPSLNP